MKNLEEKKKEIINYLNDDKLFHAKVELNNLINEYGFAANKERTSDELELMQQKAEIVIRNYNKGLNGLKRRNSLLQLAKMFKAYEERCILFANVDR